MMELYYI